MVKHNGQYNILLYPWTRTTSKFKLLFWHPSMTHTCNFLPLLLLLLQLLAKHSVVRLTTGYYLRTLVKWFIKRSQRLANTLLLNRIESFGIVKYPYIQNLQKVLLICVQLKKRVWKGSMELCIIRMAVTHVDWVILPWRIMCLLKIYIYFPENSKDKQSVTSNIKVH